MAEKKKLVVVCTRGLDDERSSVAWSIANAGIASDMEVTVFLAAAGVDWVRKGAADAAHLNPLDPPMKDMVGNLMSNCGRVLVCPPCAGVKNVRLPEPQRARMLVGRRSVPMQPFCLCV